MASVIIHSKTNCIYCVKVKELCQNYNIQYVEILYDPKKEDYEDRKNRLLSLTSWKTFPQIFVDTEFIGGYNEFQKKLQSVSVDIFNEDF
jgi:glutaredoxin